MNTNAPASIALTLLLLACGTSDEDRINAAQRLTNEFANSRFHDWNIYAVSHGEDCSVLILHVEGVILEESMVEAMQIGSGKYDVPAGGVASFARANGFRAIAYVDTTGKVWTYDVTPDAVEKLVACH